MLLALVLLAQTTVATPTPAPKLGGGFGQPKPAATAARVVITDHTLAPAQGGGGSFSVAGAPATGDAPAPDGKLTPEQTAELAWRDRNLKGQEARLAALQAYERADKANTVVLYGRPGVLHSVLMQARERNLAPYREKVAETKAVTDALPEDCRKAGCQPGWVR